MSSGNQFFTGANPMPCEPFPPAQWYAVHTRCRHEKKVDVSLRQSGVATFLPLVKEVHHWSDRRQSVEVALFSCYTFVHINVLSRARLQVLKTPGVLGLVGGPTGPIPVSSSEIEQIQRVITERLPLFPYPFLNIGQRVRVRGGVLDGMEGILTCRKGTSALVISVDAIQRSLSVSIDGYDVEAA